MLHQEKDAPTTTTTRTSDEDMDRTYLRRVAARRTKSGQTGGAPQLVDLGVDVVTHWRESLRKEGTQAALEKGMIDGTSNLGGIEGG